MYRGPFRHRLPRLCGLHPLQVTQADINAGTVSNSVSVTTTTTAPDGAPIGGSSTWQQPLERNPVIDLGEVGSFAFPRWPSAAERMSVCGAELCCYTRVVCARACLVDQ